jgi:hypothetical protein
LVIVDRFNLPCRGCQSVFASRAIRYFVMFEL